MQVCFNGDFFPADAPLLPVQNRSFKWGDGVFETAKVYQGRLLLAALHYERLAVSLRLLGIKAGESLEQCRLTNTILELCRLNNCLPSARVRLAVYRQEDGTA
ncbi:MAG: aminotransferase class IV, partial [Chitinophagaceae bacterium]